MFRFEITLEELTATFITSLHFIMENWNEEIIVVCDDDEDPEWDDEWPDWDDDVDETNYDPYLGCDFFDYEPDFFEGF